MFPSILTFEQLRQIAVLIISAVLAAILPTVGFVSALVVAWAFNVWCGMRADGVVNIKCKNWSWKKFGRAGAELIMFLAILWLVALITSFCGDKDEGLFACKTINYVFVWSYAQNGLKNLCKTHPDNKALWVIYLFIRFDFAKILKIESLIEMYENHTKMQEQILKGEALTDK